MERTTIWHTEAAAIAAWTHCGKSSDAYYRALTDWLVSGKSEETAEKVFDLAMAYASCLNQYLSCVKALPESDEAEQGRERAMKYQSFLDGDMKFIVPMLPTTHSNFAGHQTSV